MRDLIAEYKRETGRKVNPKLKFQDIDINEFDYPTEKKQSALKLIDSDGFMSNFYIVDKDFLDWLIIKAG